ncbi:MAG: hypothetical protein EXX96DRAFT_583784 [Benjaminiella poitrasii]|nr:MAG: hypothetical protein EXX96DRAFT_583784 [Benjaminiella poitrasii]
MSGNNTNYAAIDPGTSSSVKHDSQIYRITRFIRHNLYHLLTLLTIAVILILLLICSFLPNSPIFPPKPADVADAISVGVSLTTMQQGRAKCLAIQKQYNNNNNKQRQTNPRTDPTQPPILLKNAVVWDGLGNIFRNFDIYLNHGLIERIEKDIKIDKKNDKVKVIDVAGNIVTPGIVDMHSHLGVDSWPELDGTDDTNEMTQPLTPFVRTLDAFNPSDKAVRIVASGGVTTTLVLPGSGNLMGGEAFAFKLRPMPSSEDMLVQANLDTDHESKRRWMKMACGENPKRVYGNRNQMPSTRLGEAFLFRNEFAKAHNLKRQQDDWCQSASLNDRLDQAFPEDLALESLVALLRNQVHLNIHCYETHDIEAMVRHALEFNFTIAAFHHALDAYRIPNVLRRLPTNVTIATFADHWGYKKEAFGGVPQAPKILHDAGIPVALKSDHPVLNSQHLVFEAAKAAHYGLPAQVALQAVTSTPARALGLDHRLGSIQKGYDADIVIWNRDPLTLGASPLQVFVDGVALFDERPIPSAVTMSEQLERAPLKTVNTVEKDTRSFVLKNVGYYHALTSTSDPIEMVVKEGDIVCAATDCMTSADNLPSYDIQGGYVVPGLIGVGSKLGLEEISAESSTSDGHVSATKSTDPDALVAAADGLKFDTRHLQEAYRGGVLTAITAPLSSNNVVVGLSTAFKTGAHSQLDPEAVLSSAVALHFQVGHQAKSSEFPTISSQIQHIRTLLTMHAKKDNAYGRAARGEIPTVVVAHNKDEIASLLLVKRNHVPRMRLVIQGGAEAHQVAEHLAALDVAVVLWPTLCTPARFDSAHCLTGEPLTNGTAAHILHREGVKVAVGISDDGFARNLAWDAGWLASTGYGIHEHDAIGFITSNIRSIYGLSGVDTFERDFVVYDQSPLVMSSRVVLVHDRFNGLQRL